MWRGFAAICLTATLVLGPTLARGQTPPESLATVEQLYNEGRALYETADYDGAIAKWTEAYAMLGDSPDHAEVRSTLLYNLAAAHEAAFEIDGDATHLSKAKVLLERFEASIDEMYTGDALVQERERVVERLAGIEAKLAAARGESLGPTEPTEPTDEPSETAISDQPDPPDSDNPGSDAGPTHKPKPLVIAGSLALALGAAGLGAGVFGLVAGERDNEFAADTLDISSEALDRRHAQIREGQTMNAVAFAGLIGGGVLVVVGAAMLGVSARGKSRPVSAAPALGPGFAGAVVRGSF